MLPPFPIAARGRPRPFRFLDTTGLPSMPGDVSRFTAAHIRADAGDALPGAWRPIDGTRDATVSVERGCLVVSHAALEAPNAGGAGALIQIAGDFDAVVAMLVEPPSQFPSADNESYSAGVFAGIGTAARGYCMACVDSEVAGATASKVYDMIVTSFTVDPTSAELLFSPDGGGRVVAAWPSFSPLLVRLKRVAGAVRAYFSADGFSWRESNLGSSRMSGASTVDPGYIGVLVNAQMTTPAGNIRGFIPTLKFLDPNTAFPT